MTDNNFPTGSSTPSNGGGIPGDVNTPLHPNLAKLDAEYDRVVEKFSLGQLDPVRANAQIASLVARDDEGVLWHKDPSTGGWLRRTRTGQLVPDIPPTYGFATPTARDLSPGGSVVDDRVVLTDVDESLMFAPSSLSGSTRLLPDSDQVSFATRVRQHKVLVALVVLVMLVVVFFVLAGL